MMHLDGRNVFMVQRLEYLPLVLRTTFLSVSISLLFNFPDLIFILFSLFSKSDQKLILTPSTRHNFWQLFLENALENYVIIVLSLLPASKIDCDKNVQFSRRPYLRVPWNGRVGEPSPLSGLFLLAGIHNFAVSAHQVVSTHVSIKCSIGLECHLHNPPPVFIFI